MFPVLGCRGQGCQGVLSPAVQVGPTGGGGGGAGPEPGCWFSSAWWILGGKLERLTGSCRDRRLGPETTLRTAPLDGPAGPLRSPECGAGHLDREDSGQQEEPSSPGPTWSLHQGSSPELLKVKQPQDPRRGLAEQMPAHPKFLPQVWGPGSAHAARRGTHASLGRSAQLSIAPAGGSSLQGCSRHRRVWPRPTWAALPL